MAKLKYLEHTDEVLVTLTLSGDQDAYEMLVARYERSVLATARRITHDEYLAEDASQEAFVSAWIKLDCLREPARFGAWVRRIAKNCAVNIVTRLREYVSYDVLENAVHAGNCDIAEENEDERGEYIDLLRESVGKLPARVREIITLHYFDGLSVADIATRLGLAVGTVKWQLHDGRERIRKDLGVMENRIDKTLVERVMLEVEKLKLWNLRRDKTNFPTAYEKTLKAVEELPECREKDHAMADVLLRGFWWVPGQKNDELLARMKEYALKGHNDEVMVSVCFHEYRKLHGNARIEYIRDVQIPFLKEHSFVQSEGAQWFWLANTYFRRGQAKEGFEALDQVLSVLSPKDPYYANALSARRVEQTYLDLLSKGVSENRVHFSATAERYRIIDGELRFFGQPGYGRGGMYGIFTTPNHVLYNATHCDYRLFIPGGHVGDSITDDCSNTLTFVAVGETVVTPCGTFQNCELWRTTAQDREETLTWYCEGVGIVKQKTITPGKTEVRLLKSYTVVGGEGRLPCAVGNVWEYTSDNDPSILSIRSRMEIVHADEESVVFSNDWYVLRLRYDPDSWSEMALQMRSDYWADDDKGESHLTDVRPVIERCEALASTPYQKAHTRLAAATMRRILESDEEFNPDRTHSGHWNFFDICYINEKAKVPRLDASDRLYSFEWKNMGGTGDWGAPLFFNDVIGIWHDATDCLWNPEWKDGFTGELKHGKYGTCNVKTRMSCRAVGSMTTAADTFTDCLEVSLEIEGMSPGLAYRNGTKKFYFAPGVGMIRTVQDHKDHTLQGIYDLVAYEGTGEGYMPLCEGMTRRYEAQFMREGYIAAVEYAIERDSEGKLCLIEDRCGIKKL